MNNRKLDNKTLDMIGKRLIRSGALPPDDLEKIVSDPRLFSLVTKRIAADAGTHRVRVRRPFLRRHAIAFAGVAMFLVALIAAAALLTPEKGEDRAGRVEVPDRRPENARPDSPPGEVNRPLTGRASDREIRAEKIMSKAVVKKNNVRAQMQTVREPEGDFYAISTGYAIEETAAGGRIIRVNVPRSSLFAMGINIPLENGPENLQADLLVGSDGVTRAIRVVE